MRRIVAILVALALAFAVLGPAGDAAGRDTTYTVDCHDSRTSSSYTITCRSTLNGQQTTYTIRCTTTGTRVRCTDSTSSSSQANPQVVITCKLNDEQMSLVTDVKNLLEAEITDPERWQVVADRLEELDFPLTYHHLAQTIKRVATSYESTGRSGAELFRDQALALIERTNCADNPEDR